MNLARWLPAIAGVAVLGGLRVAQQHAMTLKAYTLGDRVRAVHTAESDVGWLAAQVGTLSGPMRLAHMAEEQKLKLVARTVLSPDVPLVRLADAATETP